MARNVGVNSTFEQQRLVINEIAVDVETLQNADGSYWIQTAAGIHTTSNVGVGTTNPTSKLDVYGDITISGNGFLYDSTDPNYNFRPTSWQLKGGGYITESNTNNGYIQIGEKYIYGLDSITGGDFNIQSNGNSYFRGGNFGVGINNPTSKLTVQGDGSFTGVITASSFSGSASGLTNIPSGQLTGALPAIDGSALLNVSGSGSGVQIQDNSTPVGTAGTIDFGANLTVSPVSAGVVTVTASGGGGASYWESVPTGLTTTSSIGISSTPWSNNPSISLPYGGHIFLSSNNNSRHIVAIGDTYTGNPIGRDTSLCGGIYIGPNAGRVITTSSGGIHIGSGAGRFVTNASGNLIIGNQAGLGVTASPYYDGSFSGSNICIGDYSGGSKMGRYNVLLGIYAGGGGGYPYPGGNMGNGNVVIGSFDFNTSEAPHVPLEYGHHQLVIGAGSTNWIHGNSEYNVGLGTTNPTSKLTVEGDANFSGVVTATRFESSSAGTPTIDSPNNLNINAVTVAISTNLTVGGNITVPQINGTTNISGTLAVNNTTGNGSDVGFAIKYYITEDGSSSAYRFAGPGLVNTTDNPTIYLHRGFTYIFENSTGTNHPFRIQYSGTSTGYGSTYLSGSQSGTQVFTVPFDAPSSLEYECTIHGSMKGTFTIIA